MLAQGVLCGISNGLLMFPAMAATPQYFNRRRGAAMGITVAGSSLGAIVFPVVLSKLFSVVGFGWAVRICGFIMVPFLIFSVLTVKARLPPRDSRFILWSAFKMPLYVVSLGAVFFLFLGMFIPLFYLPAYGISRGMDETLASYLVAIINGASIPGRIIPGILGDKLGRLNTLLFAGLSTAIVILCWPRTTSTAGIISFSVVFGFSSGAIISAGSVVFTLCPSNPKDIGTFMGMGIAVGSIAVLIGPPINGALLHKYHSFDQMAVFSGIMCLMGSALSLLAKVQTPRGALGLT
jgi:MFS family permease